MTALRAAILLFSLVGAAVALRMAAKSVEFARGTLREPSVVALPDARLIAGIPNAFLGVAYYLGLAAATLADARAIWIAAASASIAAAGVSIILAYRLSFTIRQWCALCWTSHAINVALAVLVVLAAIASARS